MARALLIAACLLLWPKDAHAGRPFVTDDAGVVGRGVLQLEAWLRFEEGLIQQWTVAAVGPLGPLELSAGIAAALSAADDWEPRVGGAIVQAKALALEPTPGGAPGFGGAVGVVPPAGTGSFASDEWHPYAYAMLTEVPLADERLAIHANLGVAMSIGEDVQAGPYWAIGASCAITDALAVMAELFAADAAHDARIGATQVGLFLAANEHVQIDGTFGGTVWGDDEPAVFATAGVKLASSSLW